MTMTHVVAVDIGASSGRVMLAAFCEVHKTIILTEVHRFPNQFISLADPHSLDLGHVGNQHYDCWLVDQLILDIKHGLEKILAQGIIVSSVAIDTWAVDYVLIDKNGERVGLPIAYRDHRTDQMMETVIQTLGRTQIYEKTGIQFLPFNTLYQLKAMMKPFADPAKAKAHHWFSKIAHLLLMPDYLSFALTGKLNWEYTNCSTTQLLNVKDQQWDEDLLQYLAIPKQWLGSPQMPGNKIGDFISEHKITVPVYACASHDTASAVMAAPLPHPNCAYLSSGTWSLMGFESNAPYTNATALQYNITNEGGYNGQFRVLKNIMGLWLLSQYLKELDDTIGSSTNLSKLVDEASAIAPFQILINPNDPSFLNPRTMSTAILDFCDLHHESKPQSPAEFARLIFDSLALLYQKTLHELTAVKQSQHSADPQGITQLHIVGGGSQNNLLNQLCADACQIPVVAGPVEASALGNIGCQLMALHKIPDLAGFRQCLQNNHHLTHYQPKKIKNFAEIKQRFDAFFDS